MSMALPTFVLPHQTVEQSDGQLLEQFIHQKDDAAFSMLMNRHGRMVFAMARRLLQDAADADDICQATFLVLARKAGQLERQRSLAGWLFGVARRLCSDVRKMKLRRTRHESLSARKQEIQPESTLLSEHRELARKIDDALAKLPRKYREPLLLCYWEGLTKPQASALLGWKPGTFSGRLARGKKLLRVRLEKQGILPAVVLAWFGGAGLTQAFPTLTSITTARQALTHLPGVRPLVSPTIFQLLQGAIHTMALTKMKWAAACLAALAGLFLIGHGALNMLQADDTPGSSSLTARSTTQTGNDDQKKIQGKWYCVAVALGGATPDGARKNVDDLRDQMWMDFKGDSVHIAGSPAEKQPARYTLKSDVSPRQILIDAGQMKLHGIYTLEDGLLVLRYGENASNAGDMPKSFALGEKSSGIMFVMQRERSAHQGTSSGKSALGAVAQPTDLALTQNKMKWIGLAVHNYAAVNNDKLPDNVYDSKGKAILSWRVKLLPYIEGSDALAKKFKMDEPWDSPHNKELIKLMPDVFKCSDLPGKAPAQPYTTPFRAFMGKGTMHEANRQFRFADIKDGTSLTFMFIEAADSVPWTKPDDFVYDPTRPFPATGGRFGKEFNVAFYDGAVRKLPIPTPEKAELSKTYFKMVTRAGNEIVDENELPKN